MDEARALLESGDNGKRQTKAELGKARTAVYEKGMCSECRLEFDMVPATSLWLRYSASRRA